MAFCKYCGVEISWTTDDWGIRIPVEGEIVNYDDCETGDYLLTDDGTFVRVEEDRSRPDVEGRVSHINKCRRK